MAVITRVNLGRVYLSRGVNELVAEDLRFAAFVIHCLRRHAAADWGNVGCEDAAENNRALEQGERLLSSYAWNAQVTVWLITEYDRSVTTILLPDEY